jgi:membrane protein implicated in regulation of membrane protease activity
MNPTPPLQNDYPAQPERQQQSGAWFGDGGRLLTVLALAVAVLALAVAVLALAVAVLALAILTERWQHRRSQQT